MLDSNARLVSHLAGGFTLMAFSDLQYLEFDRSPVSVLPRLNVNRESVYISKLSPEFRLA